MAVNPAEKTPELAQFTRPHEISPDLRRELTDCWTAVTNAGGAVIAASFPLPPVSSRVVEPEVDQLVLELDPHRGRLLVATVEDVLAGWLLLRRDQHPLVAHCGVVNHVQTHPRFRGRGIGAALMDRVAAVRPEARTGETYARFTSLRAQILNQSPEFRDC
ncbi:GNAT family N-acetyltransferase [Streptomyces sp. NPDC019531]|uniref:GNAT family N-acetyltransferase n=1 Tax=Streptomyces sp. NPDC019531 TaxID=3365062 RepID=UPI00384FE8F3